MLLISKKRSTRAANPFGCELGSTLNARECVAHNIDWPSKRAMVLRVHDLQENMR
jgi:hypothetical protein